MKNNLTARQISRLALYTVVNRPWVYNRYTCHEVSIANETHNYCGLCDYIIDPTAVAYEMRLAVVKLRDDPIHHPTGYITVYAVNNVQAILGLNREQWLNINNIGNSESDLVNYHNTFFEEPGKPYDSNRQVPKTLEEL